MHFLSQTDVVFLQEHWLSQDQLQALGEIDKDLLVCRRIWIRQF
jgi:hypothetical protein